MQSYLVKHAAGPVKISAEWEDPVWNRAETAKLEVVSPKSSSHHPCTQVRMLYDAQNLYGLFLVQDQYVCARSQHDQEQVCLDSCVEFFVRPAGEKKYFNFEMNCGGTILLYHIADLFTKDYSHIPLEDLDTVERFHTLPRIVDPEIVEPVTWRLGFRIPLSFFVKYARIDTNLSGQVWHTNFTKCADKSSHPHWLLWQRLPQGSFHQPDAFGELVFE